MKKNINLKVEDKFEITTNEQYGFGKTELVTNIYTIKQTMNNEYVLKSKCGTILIEPVDNIDDILIELNDMLTNEIDDWFIDYSICINDELINKDNINTNPNHIELEHITIDNFKIAFLEDSIRSCKLPMWAKKGEPNANVTKTVKNLMSSPIGSGHSVSAKGVMMYMELTATNKFWIQFQRYHHQEIISSQSSMHKLSKFDLNTMFINYTDDIIIHRLKDLQQLYTKKPTTENYLRLIYSCPAGLKLKAGITLNLEQVKTMAIQRVNHRLPEWREFIQFLINRKEFKDIIDFEKIL